VTLLLLREAAAELRVSVRTVEREIADGKLAAVMVRRRRLVARAELDRYIAAQEIPCQSVKLASAGRFASASAVARVLSEHCRPAQPEPTRRRSKLWSAASRSTLRLVAPKST
jgi:excisionase family DNA binding protein